MSVRVNAKTLLQAMLPATSEPELGLDDAIATANEWHADGGSAMYAFASNGGKLQDEAQGQQLAQEVQDCMNWVMGNAANIDSGKYPEYAEDAAKAAEAKMSTSKWQLVRLQNLQDMAVPQQDDSTPEPHIPLADTARVPVQAFAKEAKILISEDVFRRAMQECDTLLGQVGGSGSDLEGKLTKIQSELHQIEIGANGDLAFALDDENNPDAAQWARTLVRALDNIKRMTENQVAQPTPINPPVPEMAPASVNRMSALKLAGFGEDTLRAIIQFAKINKQKLTELMKTSGPQAVAMELGKIPGAGNSASRVAPAFVQWLSGQMDDSTLVGALENVLTKKAALVNDEAMHITAGALALAGFTPGEISVQGSNVSISGLNVNPHVLRHTAKIASEFGLKIRLTPRVAANSLYDTPGEQPETFPEPERHEPEGINRVTAAPIVVPPRPKPTAGGNHEGAGNPVNPTGNAPVSISPQMQTPQPVVPEPDEPEVPAVAPTGYGQGAKGQAYGQKAAAAETNPMDGEGGATLKAYKFGNPKPLMGQQENRSSALDEAEHLKTNPEIQRIEVSILWGGQWSVTNVWERSAPEAEWDEQVAHEMYRTTPEPEDDLPGTGVTAAFFPSDEDEMDAPENPCSQCGGPLVPMGTLGNLEHLRCRNCGAQVSRKVAADGTLIGSLAEIESMLTSVQELADKAVAQARMQENPDLSANVERTNVKVYEALLAVRTAKKDAQSGRPSSDEPETKKDNLTTVEASAKKALFDKKPEPCSSWEPAQEPEEPATVCYNCGWPKSKHKAKTASTQLTKGPDATNGDTVENAIEFINANGADMDEFTVQQLREALTAVGYTQQVADNAVIELLGQEALQALATPVKSLLGA